MKSLRNVFLVFSLLVFCCAINLHAQCSAPAKPGVRICTPTPNSYVAFVPAIEVNSAPKDGAIQRFIIYDNGKQIFVGNPYQTGIALYDGAVKNGLHYVVVNAWDSGGNLLQASVTFNVIGSGYSLFCAKPKAPGINFCVPPPNTVQTLNIPISATATGYSNIASISVYLDSKFQFNVPGYDYLSTSVQATSPGKHNVTMVAYDLSGHSFAASKTVLTAYDYYSCPPKGNGPCSPGFEVQSPLSESYVGNSFAIQASITNNPRPITTMQAYIGGTLVANSNGPTMYQTVKNAPSGTRVLTLQAWDTGGYLYRIQENINVNVPH